MVDGERAGINSVEWDAVELPRQVHGELVPSQAHRRPGTGLGHENPFFAFDNAHKGPLVTGPFSGVAGHQIVRGRFLSKLIWVHCGFKNIFEAYLDIVNHE